MQRILIIIGICFVFIGVFWPWLSRFPFGRLPGDIVIDRPDLRIHIPIVSMLLLSIILTIILRIFRK